MAEAVANDRRPTEPQVRALSGFTVSPNGNVQMFPVMYPALVAGLSPLQNNQEQMNHGGAGIYAVPTYPLMGSMSGIPPTTLIPFTYNVPTTGSNSSEAGQVGEEQGQVRQQEQQQQQPGPQRVVAVRRFQIAFEIDLFLILKLAAVIFLFNQDGSRQKLFLHLFLASLIYLYQTGALAPLIRWMSRGMQRAAAPPQPPRPADGVNNIPAAARQRIENAALAGGQPEPGDENENQAANDGHQAVVNEQEPGVGNAAAGNEQEPGVGNDPNGNRWWGIVKEIQMIVVGFITSFFFPGFHNID